MFALVCSPFPFASRTDGTRLAAPLIGRISGEPGTTATAAYESGPVAAARGPGACYLLTTASSLRASASLLVAFLRRTGLSGS